MNIGEMPAGRELDALVAERVMGWTEVVMFGVPPEGLGVPPEGDALYGTTVEGDIKATVPGYSTDIAAAHDIIEHLVAEGHPISIFWGSSIGKRNFVSVLIVSAPLPSGDSICNTGETAPLALCRAALKFTEAMEGK